MRKATNMKELNERLRDLHTEKSRLEHANQEQAGYIVQLKDENKNLRNELTDVRRELDVYKDGYSEVTNLLAKERTELTKLRNDYEALKIVSDLGIKDQAGVIRSLRSEVQFKKAQNNIRNELYDKLAERVKTLEVESEEIQDKINKLDGIPAHVDELFMRMNKLEENFKSSPAGEPVAKKSPQFVLIVGNPVDGCEYYGPFTDAEDAHALGEKFQGDWWVKELLEDV